MEERWPHVVQIAVRLKASIQHDSFNCSGSRPEEFGHCGKLPGTRPSNTAKKDRTPRVHSV